VPETATAVGSLHTH